MGFISDRKRAVGYIRVSTAKQVDGYSLSAQQTRIEKYTEALDFELVKLYKDEGKSGKNVSGRPEFMQMLDDIENGKIDVNYVIVYKLSRFGRSSADMHATLERLKRYNTHLICIDENIDTSQPTGKLLLAVVAAVAEIDRENIKEQTMAGRRQKALEGGWNGAKPPYGYVLEDGNLVIDETKVEAVKLLYDRYINTSDGYTGVADYLNNRGVEYAGQYGITLWSSTQVKKMLSSEVYCGLMPYGKRKTVDEYSSDNKSKVIFTDNYSCVEGKHEAIISLEDWKKAENKRIQRSNNVTKVARKKTHLLSGLLVCPKCNGPMYSTKGGVKKNGDVVYYYKCNNMKKSKKTLCNYGAQIRADEIEAEVLLAIKSLVSNQVFAESIKSKIGTQVDTKHLEKELSDFTRSLQQKKTAIETLQQNINNTPFDLPYRERIIEDKNKNLNNLYPQLIEIEDRIADVRLRIKAVEADILTQEQIYAILQNFDNLYVKMNELERHELLKNITSEICIFENQQDKDKNRVKEITFKFPVKYGEDIGNVVSWDNEKHVETVVKIVKL